MISWLCMNDTPFSIDLSWVINICLGVISGEDVPYHSFRFQRFVTIFGHIHLQVRTMTHLHRDARQRVRLEIVIECNLRRRHGQ